MLVPSVIMLVTVVKNGIVKIYSSISCTHVIFQNGLLKEQPLISSKKNVSNFTDNSALNKITSLYKPVRKGDLYSLKYSHSNQTLSLSLNQKPLGKITDTEANQYFKIWFGSQPFNAKLKQQLLNQ